MSFYFRCFACTNNTNNYDQNTPLNHDNNCPLTFPITGDESGYSDAKSQNRASRVNIKAVERFDDESSILDDVDFSDPIGFYLRNIRQG